jgi:hypothetical protein
MEVPAFSENGKGFCLRVKKAPELGIVFAADPRFAGGAERAELRPAMDPAAELCTGGEVAFSPPEKFRILGVASGIARFDPGDSQLVEGADYGEFILYGKIYSFTLGSIAEAGVEYFNVPIWQVPTPLR